MFEALLEIDGGVLKQPPNPEEISFISELYTPKEKRLELYEAMDLSTEEVSFAQAVGRISGSKVNLYPPGIPVLLPGEVIDANFIKNIRKCREFRLNLQGIADIINERINVARF